MEHDDRPPVASFVGGGPFAAGAVATLGEGPAHHARVKRLEAGDRIRLTDGAGRVALGSIAAIRKSSLEITVHGVTDVPPPAPIHLRVPIGDRDRMLWLAEKATELGISTWQAVRFQRSASVSPRGEGSQFAEKVRARMVSALEQSGGAWLPRMLPDADITDVAAVAGESGEDEDFRIVLDLHGDPLPLVIGLDARRAPVILFGPEGGIEPLERAALESAGWRRARLADTTLRFETAGVAAVAVVRASHMLRET
ncbi:MAG: Ribosomal small subunit methyltransferase [Gemmatimonadetes bacterium]|nr:Ribosomal small subunit methyltransferase [Gemmatimonadota bacterium]